MRSWTGGAAGHCTTYDVCNGLGAWLGLRRNQLPGIKHQKQLLVNEFNSLVKASTLAGPKARLQDIERITSKHTDMSEDPFVEEVGPLCQIFGVVSERAFRTLY